MYDEYVKAFISFLLSEALEELWWTIDQKK